jgi:hypothetical protein
MGKLLGACATVTGGSYGGGGILGHTTLKTFFSGFNSGQNSSRAVVPCMRSVYTYLAKNAV